MGSFGIGNCAQVNVFMIRKHLCNIFQSNLQSVVSCRVVCVAFCVKLT